MTHETLGAVGSESLVFLIGIFDIKSPASKTTLEFSGDVTDRSKAAGLPTDQLGTSSGCQLDKSGRSHG